MAEKGGKGFSPSIGGKSSLTSLGKDDTSAKKKRERKAKFDYEDPVDGTRSNGVAHEPISKGDGGKGRKGGKPANSSKAKESSLELPIETELPENTKCLMDCEAAEILQGIQDHMVVLSSDPAIKIPISFDKGLKYAKRGSVYPNPKAARQILEPLKKFGISDAEMCMISNIQVESVDEVFALVPSLEGKKLRLTEPLKDMLDELAKVKSSA
ncbi:hypothetical protein M9H77_11654 [Catharanthus roseus]|uniref:Uncharacterized protein n=1 Tax=Catharanthus roseus TaxID=4058 RepID=A0ACC0BF88_CATRO|nr:hypothetical protein M9H77_11654 [Catharanthus roseus]